MTMRDDRRAREAKSEIEAQAERIESLTTKLSEETERRILAEARVSSLSEALHELSKPLTDELRKFLNSRGHLGECWTSAVVEEMNHYRAMYREAMEGIDSVTKTLKDVNRRERMAYEVERGGVR